MAALRALSERSEDDEGISPDKERQFLERYWQPFEQAREELQKQATAVQLIGSPGWQGVEMAAQMASMGIGPFTRPDILRLHLDEESAAGESEDWKKRRKSRRSVRERFLAAAQEDLGTNVWVPRREYRRLKGEWRTWRVRRRKGDAAED